MDGIGSQCHRPGDEHDHDLGDCGQPEDQQADLDRTDPGSAGFQGIVDTVGDIVGVRREDLLDGPAQPVPMPGPTTIAAVPADEATFDLGWLLTGPTTTAVPVDDATVGVAGTSGTGDVAPGESTTAGVTPPAPSGTAVAPDAASGAQPTAEPATSAGQAPAAHGAAPQVPPAARVPVEGEGATVVVVRGDTLWGIAARHLPPDAGPAQVAAAWPDWYAANAATIGPDPGLILPGQVLVVPAGVTR